MESINFKGTALWNIDKMLKEDDVEVEDDETDEDEAEIRKEKTPDLHEDIFREDEESLSIAECF